MKYILLMLVLCGVNKAEVFVNEMGYLECNMTDTVCSYEFDVQQYVSMTYNGYFVYVNDAGNLLYTNGDGDAQQVPKEDHSKLMTLDGYYRLVLAINGTIPGPHIVVYKDQKLNIRVNNKLQSNTLSIHWHGIWQNGTPWMDGVAWINQCPIGAGQFYTYEFEVPAVGTYWYHSHVTLQRTNGIFGGLIVKERPAKAAEEVPTDIIMTLGEWQHHMADQLFYQYYTSTGGSLGGWVGALIEGKGRYWKQGPGGNKTLVKAPLKWFQVKKGKSYRFRVIGVGSYYSFRVSVDGHQLRVVATDGFDIKPIIAESFIINSGERYDFILKANQTPKNYLIKADVVSFDKHSLVPDPEMLVHAVLQYTNKEEPDSMRTNNCTQKNPCKVVNCQYPKYPANENIECVNMTVKDPEKHPVSKYDKNDKKSVEHHFNFGFRYGMAHWNGRSFITPGVNALTQTDQLGIYKCAKTLPEKKEPYYCFQEIEIPEEVATVQLVLSSLGEGSGSHPIHLHGHTYQVLKVAFGDYDASNKLVDNKDIACNDKHCTAPKWANLEWGGNNIDGLNLVDPPLKDTVYVPQHGYVVIRFTSNNPGKWLMHCHIEDHLASGMGVVLSEKMTKLPTPPQGLPICSDFYNNSKKDFKIENNPPGETTYRQKFFIVASVGGPLILLQLIVIVVGLVKYRSLRRGTAKAPTGDTGFHIRNTNL